MITFPTSRPQALLNAFSKAIKDGDITTWEKDGDGDFFHKAQQWTKRAWLRPKLEDGVCLKFFVLIRNEDSEKRAVYAFHSTRIVESFINHFPKMFTPDAKVTPNSYGSDSDF